MITASAQTSTSSPPATAAPRQAAAARNAKSGTGQETTRTRRARLRLFKGGRLLLCVLTAQTAFTLTLTAWLHLAAPNVKGPEVLAMLCAAVAAGLVLSAAGAAARTIHAHGRERDRHRATSELMDTILETSQEWLWSVNDAGTFTSSSKASAAMLGYEPSELIGQPFSLIIDEENLSKAHEAVAAALTDANDWHGVIVACRHHNGTQVLMEVSGKSRPTQEGRGRRHEGTSRLLPPPAAEAHLRQQTREQINSAVDDGMILTAFQPIHDLAKGAVHGVEALARFPRSDGRSPEHWFTEAASVGLGEKLEFAALAAALRRSAKLPGDLYVSFNVSPQTCLDARLPTLIRRSGLPLGRIVLELTERLAVADYAQLRTALEPLRRDGVRLAVDDAGSGFASMRHILQLSPDIIKLDRILIAGIDTDPGLRALAAAMTGFARQIGAQIVAEGIETLAELRTVTQLGMTSAQGYLLGHPTLLPTDWTDWHPKRFSLDASKA